MDDKDRAEQVRAIEVAHAHGYKHAVDLLARHGAVRRQVAVDVDGVDAIIVLDQDPRTIPRSLRAATRLSLSNHVHPQLPVGLVQLQCLQRLTLNSCPRLKSLPAEIGQLQGFQQLTIEICVDLESLPEEMGQLQGLQQLTLMGCGGLKSLPAEVGQLKGLQQLTIAGCHGLQSLPAEMGQLQGLQQLTIQTCGSLKSLPAEVGQLQGLQQLTIFSCPGLKWLPAEVGQLQGLQQLTIVNCRTLESLPAEVGQLKGLSSSRSQAATVSNRCRPRCSDFGEVWHPRELLRPLVADDSTLQRAPLRVLRLLSHATGKVVASDPTLL